MKITNITKDSIYLGIGTNVGNRKKNILRTIYLLGLNNKIKVIKISSIYETTAWGYTSQKQFYNCVVKIGTNLKPKELLHACKNIEKRMARTKKFKWGPRIIDIDILIYKDIKKYTKQLTIPHKYITQRIFVLVPLAEIDSDIKLNGQSLNYFIDRLNEKIEPVKS